MPRFDGEAGALIGVAALAVTNGVLAGITLAVACLDLWLWSRERANRTPLWLGMLAISQALVLLSGTAVLVRPSHAPFELALFLRSGTLGISTVLAVIAMGHLIARLRVRLAAWLIGAVVVARMVFWVTGDLVVRHPLHAGRWPSYGWLGWASAVYGLGLLVVTLCAIRLSTGLVRTLLASAALVTVLIGVATMIAGSGESFEALLNLSVAPSAIALFVLGARQISWTARARDRLLVRQAALAETGRRAAITTAVDDLVQDAEHLLARELGDPRARIAVLPDNGAGPDAAPAGAVTVRGRRCTATASTAVQLDVASREFVSSLLQIVAAGADRSAIDADLAHSATHDLLTGLPNRVLLLDRLDAQLAAGGDEHTVVLLCGLSGVDEVISVHGHRAAEALIRRVAVTLQGLVDRGTTVGRWSHEVFAVIEDAANRAPSIVLNRRLTDLSRTLAERAQLPIQVHVHVGAVVAGPHSTRDGVFRDATAAMRRAATNASGTEIFDDALGVRLRHRVELENTLRHAVDRDEIEVHYQPVVDARTRVTRSYEALARWRRRDGTVVAPGEWVQLAEDSGLIDEIGLHVLRLAARDQAVLRVPVAVNVSPHQLAAADFPLQVLNAIHGCPPEQVMLEVTESAVMADLDRACHSLQILREHGIVIALDDFGTSYSSLGLLAALPIDVLKIDQIFVEALDTPAGVSVVDAIVTLARDLGKSTVAEGVETEAQLAALLSLGADRIQGFLTGRPEPVTIWQASTPRA